MDDWSISLARRDSLVSCSTLSTRSSQHHHHPDLNRCCILHFHLASHLCLVLHPPFLRTALHYSGRCSHPPTLVTVNTSFGHPLPFAYDLAGALLLIHRVVQLVSFAKQGCLASLLFRRDPPPSLTLQHPHLFSSPPSHLCSQLCSLVSNILCVRFCSSFGVRSQLSITTLCIPSSRPLSSQSKIKIKIDSTRFLPHRPHCHCPSCRLAVLPSCRLAVLDDHVAQL